MADTVACRLLLATQLYMADSYGFADITFWFNWGFSGPGPDEMLKLLDGEAELDHVLDPAAAIPDQSTRMSRIQTKTPPDEEDMLLVGKSRGTEDYQT